MGKTVQACKSTIWVRWPTKFDLFENTSRVYASLRPIRQSLGTLFWDSAKKQLEGHQPSSSCQECENAKVSSAFRPSHLIS